MKLPAFLDNALMREVLAIRIDSVFRLLHLLSEDQLPPVDAEGATGELDNKGALFVPGGLVLTDSDQKPVRRERGGPCGEGPFRERVRRAMHSDNATLLYPDGIATGVNLDNGFFADMAGTILASKQAALKRRPFSEAGPSPRIDSEQISHSHCPGYVTPPFGARTRISSCLAVCLIEARLYYISCRRELGLRGPEEQRVWDGLREARHAILGIHKTPLAPAAIVVCHTTRYRDHNLGGITRILGYGRFGEFACLSMERVTSRLLAECRVEERKIPGRYVAADRDGVRVAAVLRYYPATKPGHRQLGATARLIAPEEDLGLDLAALERAARERYRL